MIAEVIVDISNSEVDKVFDYLIDIPNLGLGYRVLVPFGNREIEGYIIAVKEKSNLPKEKIKSVLRALDDVPVILDEMLKLMHFMKAKYHLRLVDTLRLFIPSEMRGGRVKELIKQYVKINPEFLGKDVSEFIKPSSFAQVEVYEFLHSEENPVSLTYLNSNFSASAIRNLIGRDVLQIFGMEVKRTPYRELDKRYKKITLTKKQEQVIGAINAVDNEKFLLHGVTGSGKTEVYMNCISAVLSKGKTAIMLVPEISLTPQVFKNLGARFGDDIAILHSGLSAGERFDEWRRLLSGDAKIAIGARSAIFAPIKDLGIIIIDEEHDSSYSSESNPRYFTHEIAEFRRNFNSCNMVLGSATPSVETYHETMAGGYKLLELPERVNDRPLPEIRIVNMCSEVYNGNTGIFSTALESSLHECMDANNQAIIFINRRGYSSFMRCNSCGYVAKCERCDVSLVYHREENILKCHYCGNRYEKLDMCPECKSPSIRRGFIGTEQVCEKLTEMFPKKVIIRMDNDTTQSKDSHLKILEKFSKKEASILVGTQMIAKGHDFPDVTLVGIVDADLSLFFNDFRSIERTYQLITQVSGRAGRESKSGKVILQTYSPKHYVYKFATNNDFKSFYEKEVNLREVTKFPPFSRIIRILLSSEQDELASKVLKQIYDAVQALSKEYVNDFAYIGVMRSPIKKIQNKNRMQVLMRITDNYKVITERVYEILDKYQKQKVTSFVEINPNNLS